jgi:hypothetical protein
LSGPSELQNLIWASRHNVNALPLAAGVLAPFGVLISPAVGAILMSVSTIIVALSAQLLRRQAFEPARGCNQGRSTERGSCLGAQAYRVARRCRFSEQTHLLLSGAIMVR